MKNKFYTLFAVLSFASLLSARGQIDPGGPAKSICDPRFSVKTYQHTANFTAIDSSGLIIHSWNFGDHQSLTGHLPYVSHAYAAPGQYIVIHYKWDSLGLTCHDSSIQVVVIDTGSVSPLPPPVCSISFDTFIDSTSLPHKIWFYANPVVHGRDSLTWYVNGTLVSRNDSVYADTFSKGYYTVCVTLNTAGGCTSNFCQNISVGSYDTTHTPPPPPPPYDTCSISFSYLASASHPNEIHFMAHDSTGLDSLTWIIATGSDSAILYGHNPVFVFSDTGCFYVGLYATSPTGCWSYTEKRVCIDSVPGSNFIASYPNPVLSQSNIDLRVDQDSRIYINIYNSMGHVVLSKSVAGIRGMNHLVLPTGDLPKGVYYVQIRYGNVTKRSMIQKL